MGGTWLPDPIAILALHHLPRRAVGCQDPCNSAMVGQVLQHCVKAGPLPYGGISGEGGVGR